MANICVGRIRSNHELAWDVPPLLRRAAAGLRLGYLDRILTGIDGKPFLAQLTSYYLAAIGEESVRRTGLRHTFEVREAREEDFDVPAGTDTVLFTVNTPAAPATYRVADRLRRDGIRVVLGGIHPTMLPVEAAAHADAVVRGEAEGGTLEAVLGDLDSTAGLRARYEGGRCASLAGLPAPRWPRPPDPEVCPWTVPVQTSRGCRNACSFCSTTRHQGADRRHRPVEEIVAEISGFQAGGLLTPDKSVFFTDNNIVSDTDHRRGVTDTTYARSLFRALAPLGIAWHGQGEIAVADDPEMLDLLACSGCQTLLIGLETLDDRSLQTMGKVGMRVEDNVRRIEALHRYGIRVIGCFILGLDEDGPDVFDRTADFIERYIDVPQVSVMTPFPGTALYARLTREGRILHRDWSRYDITHVVHRPKRMSPEDLDAGYRRVLRRVFSWPRTLGRATRAAFRPAWPWVPRVGRLDRWVSVLATNLVYGSLVSVDPGDAASAHVRPGEWTAVPGTPPDVAAA
jgi:radical SAM superfamily enzyme YgiQ (UPF0313 family)